MWDESIKIEFLSKFLVCNTDLSTVITNCTLHPQNLPYRRLCPVASTFISPTLTPSNHSSMMFLWQTHSLNMNVICMLTVFSNLIKWWWKFQVSGRGPDFISPSYPETFSSFTWSCFSCSWRGKSAMNFDMATMYSPLFEILIKLKSTVLERRRPWL